MNSYDNSLQQLTGENNPAIFAQNLKVMRQTYMLLAANLLFSATCAYIGMKLNIRVPALLMFGVVFGASFAISRFRNSGVGILILFAFTGFMGIAVSDFLSALFHNGMGDVVVKALVGTAIIFSALSAYTLFTKTNFNFLGGFLFVGALVGMLTMLGALFFNMTVLSAVGSGAFVLISSGYILYTTSQLVRGEQTNYIIATMSLFMDIFNLFISLLNLLTIFSGRD